MGTVTSSVDIIAEIESKSPGKDLRPEVRPRLYVGVWVRDEILESRCLLAAFVFRILARGDRADGVEAMRPEQVDFVNQDSLLLTGLPVSQRSKTLPSAIAVNL